MNYWSYAPFKGSGCNFVSKIIPKNIEARSFKFVHLIYKRMMSGLPGENLKKQTFFLAHLSSQTHKGSLVLTLF